jgi:hypothetical protein
LDEFSKINFIQAKSSKKATRFINVRNIVELINSQKTIFDTRTHAHKKDNLQQNFKMGNLCCTPSLFTRKRNKSLIFIDPYSEHDSTNPQQLTDYEINSLMECTSMNRDEIIKCYDDFLRDVPTGVIDRNKFIELYKEQCSNKQNLAKVDTFAEFVFK